MPITHTQCAKSTSQYLENNTYSFVKNSASLKDGIWPRSKILWMSVLYMALYIIRPWEELFPWLGNFYPERVYVLCMIMAVFFSTDKHFRMTWQTSTVFLFFASITISGLFAYNSSLAWETQYRYISIVIFYLILLIIVRSQYELVFIVISYIAIMCIYLGKSQWEFFVNGRHRYNMGVVRMVGIENTFGGPNDLAMSIVVSLPFAIFLWKYRECIGITWPNVWQIRFKRFLLLYGALAVSSILLTNSRSGLIGFLFYVAIFMFSGKGIAKKLLYLITGVLLLSLLWLVIPDENKGRIRTIWAPEEGPANAQASADGRIEGFIAGMDMFKRYPLTGVGAGNFVLFRVEKGDGVPLQAHNLEGQVLGELGLLGGATFLMMVWATLANCRKIARLSRNQNNEIARLFGDFASTCSISLILLIVLGLFGHNLYRYNWLWLAAFSVLALQFLKNNLENETIT